MIKKPVLPPEIKPDPTIKEPKPEPEIKPQCEPSVEPPPPIIIPNIEPDVKPIPEEQKKKTDTFSTIAYVQKKGKDIVPPL
ncbi:MAG: hypothetical protein ACK5D5_04890 [Bacteroidota bacterium]|jgi:hypothetical protein